MLVPIIRLIFVSVGVIFAALGFQLFSPSIFPLDSPLLAFLLTIGWIFVGAGTGYVLGGLVGRRLVRVVNWLENFLEKLPASDLIFGNLGLAFGMALAYLLFPLLREIGKIGIFLAAIIFFLLGSLGFELFRRRKEEFREVIGALTRSGENKGGNITPLSSGKILDTSAIIDGRIADICQAGFIEGRIKIPRFVLKELQNIADSADGLKRNRGRRGLEVLSRLQEELPGKVQILEDDFPEEAEVDEKLVKLAKKNKEFLLTVDYNLHKIAEVQGLKVLNINELAKVLKPVVLPGEKIRVKLMRAGKEPGQGVGYLDDGTMVVVEEGKNYLGEEVETVVASVLQTSSGKMIFTKLEPDR